MPIVELFDETEEVAATPAQRDFLLRRLADLAVMPSGLMTGQERGLATTVMAAAVSRLDETARRRLAERIAELPEGPHELALALANDDISVAEPILRSSTSLEESDLVHLIQAGIAEQCMAIASRKIVPMLVVDALVKYANSAVLSKLLENKGAHISARSMEVLVQRSSAEPQFLPLLMERPELSVRLAQLMFWWAPSSMREQILLRFSVERRALHAALRETLEPGIAGAGTDDALRIMLSLVRPPNLVAKLQFAQILTMATHKREEIFLAALGQEARLRADTLLRIVKDQGGEPLSVLGKAMGLSRKEFGDLIMAVISFRSDHLPGSSDVERMIAVFDSISIDRADVVLHYWDWAISSETQLPPVAPVE